MTPRVRMGPPDPISCWSRYHRKSADGLETAEHDRLKLALELM